MDTFGALVDKLAIVNVRIWHLIERRRDQTLPDAERLKLADMIDEANGQRNALIDEIDDMLHRIASSGKAPQAPKLKL